MLLFHHLSKHYSDMYDKENHFTVQEAIPESPPSLLNCSKKHLVSCLLPSSVCVPTEEQAGTAQY